MAFTFVFALRNLKLVDLGPLLFLEHFSVCTGWSRQWSSHGVIRLAHSIVSGGSSGRAPKWSISALNDGRDPLFSTIFSRTCDRSSIDLVQKCSVIFLPQQTTADMIWARSEPRDPRFSTSKTALCPQVAQKSGSESVRSILLRSCLKSTSGTLTRLHSFEIAPAAQ